MDEVTRKVLRRAAARLKTGILKSFELDGTVYWFSENRDDYCVGGYAICFKQYRVENEDSTFWTEDIGDIENIGRPLSAEDIWDAIQRAHVRMIHES